MEKITTFRGQYHFLSNFYRYPVHLDEVLYPTVEHAFQAAKTEDITERIRIKKQKTPGLAKRYGRNVQLRDDWEHLKLWKMEEFLREKFAEGGMKNKLLATEDVDLIEGNYWHDNFWGNCACKKCEILIGQNNLGKLLMAIRGDLQDALHCR